MPYIFLQHWSRKKWCIERMGFLVSLSILTPCCGFESQFVRDPDPAFLEVLDFVIEKKLNFSERAIF